jgi:hypothetical protein
MDYLAATATSAAFLFLFAVHALTPFMGKTLAWVFGHLSL